MKVKDLINVLQSCPPGAKVLAFDPDQQEYVEVRMVSPAEHIVYLETAKAAEAVE